MNDSRNKTDFLFSNPTFVGGIGSAFNIGGNYYKFNGSRSGREADARAIASDWAVIHQDIKVSFSDAIESLNDDLDAIAEQVVDKPKGEEPSKSTPEKVEVVPVPQGLLDLFEGDEQKARQAVAVISMESFYSGPLPPAEMLEQYNRIIPNGAERIMAMTERQSAHRITIEDYSVKEQHKQSGKGQKFGFYIGLFGLACATALGLLGHVWLAAIISISTIGGLAIAFVTGKVLMIFNLGDKG